VGSAYLTVVEVDTGLVGIYTVNTVSLSSGVYTIGVAVNSGGASTWTNSTVHCLSWTGMGKTGTSGTSGTSGSSGRSGTSGTSGTSQVHQVLQEQVGHQEVAGTSWFISGSSGRSGTSGTSGTTGTSGTSSSSGSSGISGVAEVGSPITLTTQGAAIGSSIMYTTVASDFYQVNWAATVTRAATTSSTLGPFQISYTNNSDNVLKTFPTTAVVGYNQSTLNTTGAAIGGTFTIYARTTTPVSYIMGYTSVGATTMQYDLSITITRIQ
jgi:hypothetical protein